MDMREMTSRLALAVVEVSAGVGLDLAGASEDR
jgi:hypothetical protein